MCTWQRRGRSARSAYCRQPIRRCGGTKSYVLRDPICFNPIGVVYLAVCLMPATGKRLDEIKIVRTSLWYFASRLRRVSASPDVHLKQYWLVASWFTSRDRIGGPKKSRNEEKARNRAITARSVTAEIRQKARCDLYVEVPYKTLHDRSKRCLQVHGEGSVIAEVVKFAPAIFKAFCVL